MLRIKKRMGGLHTAPSWFVRELRLLCSKFSVIWLNEAGRWAVVSPAPMNVFREGYVVEYLVENNGRFADLNAQVIHNIRKLLYEKNRLRTLDDHLKQQGEAENTKVDKAVEEMRDRRWGAMKQMARLATTKTFT